MGNKKIRLYEFIFEINKKNTNVCLYSETVYLKDNLDKEIYNWRAEEKIKFKAMSLIEEKKTHSFLRNVKIENWSISICLATVNVFENEEILKEYFKRYNMKAGHLFGSIIDETTN